MTPPIGRDGGPGQPWTVKVARWSARHRWPVFGAWFVLTIGLVAVSTSMGGIKALSATGGPGSGSTTEAARGFQAMNAGGTSATPSETMTVVIASATAKVTDPTFRSTVGEVVARLAAVRATVAGAESPAFDTVTDPYTTPPQSGLYAPDLRAVIVNGRITGDAGGQHDTGQWHIAGDRLCISWSKWLGGQMKCSALTSQNGALVGDGLTIKPI